MKVLPQKPRLVLVLFAIACCALSFVTGWHVRGAENYARNVLPVHNSAIVEVCGEAARLTVLIAESAIRTEVRQAILSELDAQRWRGRGLKYSVSQDDLDAIEAALRRRSNR